MEINKIYNEDCLDGMKRIADGSVDMIVADPPYTMTKRAYRDWETDRKSTRLNSSHSAKSRMPSSA